ncbi:MAG: ABC transporter ATP-binding protein [Variibacter sp.]|uniref:ABC transporter ATP-binding protein n=1 Tax=Pseudorhodoplanes sp. TaxID=1934341 RepID=UPI003D143E0C
MTSDALLKVHGLKKQFPIRAGLFGFGGLTIDAVSDVSFEVMKGETLAIVGESGCGKSTVGRCVLKLIEPTAGKIYLDGERIDGLRQRQLRPRRKKIQVVFQDPFSSLNPRMRIRDALAEPLENFRQTASRRETDARVDELLRMVGLPPDCADRWAHEFSGGQRQRIGIARALATNPQLVICDEAVSALDVSVKAQIVNLLRKLQQETGIAFLFISHDLAIVENIAHRIAVMYLGKIVETARTKDIISRPHHPYTRALLAAVPIPDPTRRRTNGVIQGEIPSATNPPTGCRFHTRCPFAFDRCRKEEPQLGDRGGDRFVACHLPELPEMPASTPAVLSA